MMDGYNYQGVAKAYLRQIDVSEEELKFANKYDPQTYHIIMDGGYKFHVFSDEMVVHLIRSGGISVENLIGKFRAYGNLSRGECVSDNLNVAVVGAFAEFLSNSEIDEDMIKWLDSI